jgi:hypothetical protein
MVCVGNVARSETAMALCAASAEKQKSSGPLKSALVILLLALVSIAANLPVAASDATAAKPQPKLVATAPSIAVRRMAHAQRAPIRRSPVARCVSRASINDPVCPANTTGVGKKAACAVSATIRRLSQVARCVFITRKSTPTTDCKPSSKLSTPTEGRSAASVEQTTLRSWRSIISPAAAVSTDANLALSAADIRSTFGCDERIIRPDFACFARHAISRHT